MLQNRSAPAPHASPPVPPLSTPLLHASSLQIPPPPPPLTQAAAAIFSHVVSVPTRIVDSTAVVLAYCRTTVAEGAALRAYLEDVRRTAQAMGEDAVQRGVFVRGLRDRARKNLRVFRIAVLFLFPMLVRYHKATGKSIFDNVDLHSAPALTVGLAKLEFEARKYRVCVCVRRVWSQSSGAVGRQTSAQTHCLGFMGKGSTNRTDWQAPF